MLRTLTASIAVATVLVLGGAALEAAPTSDADSSLVAQGRYLATAGDCAACHNDPKTGNPFAGGYGVESPLGTIYGSNITPSRSAGIGAWSLAQFSDAVRKGQAPGGHYLYPAMPYTAFAGLSDADVKALYSYFMLGVAPVDHTPPETRLAFPFSVRASMIGWNLLYSRSQPARATPVSGVARGRYLVETLGHCSTCHTPRDSLMGEKSDRFLTGGKVGSWTAPNITSDPDAGIGRWSQADLVRYLKTGALHGKAIAGGEMGTAVQNSFSKLTDGDLQDIAAYVRSVPGARDKFEGERSGWRDSAPLRADQLEHPMDRKDVKSFIDVDRVSGAALYESACASCHGHNGRGSVDHVLPPLVGSSAVGSADPSNLVMTITQGIDRTVDGQRTLMPAFGPQHTEFGPQFNAAQVAKVADYVATAFGNPNHHVTPDDVERIYHAKNEKGWLIASIPFVTWTAMAAVIALGIGAIWQRRKRKRAVEGTTA
ncbi:cytochrome c [Novosphingobium terrae]|uniref:cytochrome c n=1 Tax=Novosphingobium terrae TaxID=2726189 RepID=UPI0019821620|nr:cytochrome c [Novosphingobium terrae]